MRSPRLVLQLLLLIGFAATGPAAHAIDLDGSFQAAIQKSETLSDQDEQLVQAQSRYSQALGSLLPNLSGSAVYQVQQSPSDPLFQNFFPSSQQTVKLSVSQPIFRGLREFATLRQLSRMTSSHEQSKKAAMIRLFTDVAQNFYILLSLEQEIESLQAQVGLYEDRISELKQRTRTGQSSASDALTAQASKAMVQAQMKQIAGKYRSTRETFAFLTGLPQDTTLTRPKLSFPTQNTPIADYLKNIEERPDIVATKEKLDASDEAVAIAKGAHLPSADLTGNYYLVRPIVSEIKWDVQATLTIPIFAGGATQSKVKEAASQRTQTELALSQTRRLAEQEIRSLYESYQSGLEQIQALEQSMTLAEKNYEVLKKDYSRGLTRNIDVLQALTQFQESKRALNRARWDTQSEWERLQVVSASRSLSAPSSAPLGR